MDPSSYTDTFLPTEAPLLRDIWTTAIAEDPYIRSIRFQPVPEQGYGKVATGMPRPTVPPEVLVIPTVDNIIGEGTYYHHLIEQFFQPPRKRLTAASLALIEQALKSPSPSHLDPGKLTL